MKTYIVLDAENNEVRVQKAKNEEALQNELNSNSAYMAVNNKTSYKPNYHKAYTILMDYWDSLPDEQKEHIDAELKECGL